MRLQQTAQRFRVAAIEEKPRPAANRGYASAELTA